MNINECMEKLLDSIVIYDDIWEKDDEGQDRRNFSHIEDVVKAVKETKEKKGCCKYIVCYHKFLWNMPKIGSILS